VEFAPSGIFDREMERAVRVATFASIFVALILAEPAFGAELTQAAGCSGAGTAGASAAQERASMHCLVNSVRAQHGLSSLREVPALDRSSALRAGAIRRCGDFSHTPCGQPFVQPFVQVGYLRRNGVVAENLAWGGSTLGAPEATLESWLRSPDHRANLLRPGWRDFGLALVRGTLFGSSAVSLWVVQFGRRSG
jgi:uncharacterized protein YkwD